jgi:hypothetical protein
MEAMREAWTDDRLDDLNRKVDDGFHRVDARFEAMQAHMDKRFDAMQAHLDRRFEGQDARFEGRFDGLEKRIDGLQRTLIISNGTIIAALIGLIATRV